MTDSLCTITQQADDAMSYDLSTFSNVREFVDCVWLDFFVRWDGKVSTLMASQKANRAGHLAEQCWNLYVGGE